MVDKNLEPPNMSGDLWPIGFDVDIALDSTKNGLSNLHSNILHNTSTTHNGYTDVQQMFFNKLDDLNERDISQITDLTNSLPKGDNAQNLYAKFSCQELANELANAQVPKSSQSIFGTSAPNQEILAMQKQSYSMDIFGKVTFHDGKVTLQLKSFQMAPHFSNNIEECWICKEKILSNIESHRHSLHGLFQVNAEYVQIDIDQYILPVPAISMPSSNIMKLPINNIDLPNISDNSLHNAEVYHPFGDRNASEADCTGLRYDSEVNKVPNVPLPKTIDDVNFTQSLVTNSVKSQQLPSINFINMNLPGIDMPVNRTRADASNLNPEAPYLLPNVPTSDALLMDKIRPQHVYNADPPKQMENYQSLFTNQCNYSQLSIGNKSFADSTDITKIIGAEENKKKVEVGAKKRKSKMASRKSSVIKMKGEEYSVPCSSAKIDQGPLEKTALASVDQQTPSISEQKQFVSADRSSIDANKTTENVVKPKKKLRLNCYLCTNVYKNETSYLEHMEVHDVPKSELFSCQTCSEKFDSVNNYLSHLKTHRPKFLCNGCGTSYSSQEKLNRHVDSVHKAKRNHKCHFCSKAFSRLEYLKSHLNIHTGTKFECSICRKLFSSKFNLTMHKKIHSNFRGHKCDLCDKSFLRRSFLNTHVQRDHKNKKFQCDICLKLFSRIDVLKRHKGVHENSRVTYSCHICKKSYSRKHILSTHIKTHENYVALKCDLCSGTFKKKQSLQKHLKLHKIKEQCHICQKFLPSAQRLQNHLLWHEKQLKLKFEREYFGTVKCDSCPKSFASRQLLNRHVTRSHKQTQIGLEPLNSGNEREKKFFCKQCSKAFTRSCNLKSHMKTHNNESEDEEMLAGLPSVLSASKSGSANVKRSFPPVDNDAKYMRLESYGSKIGEISHLAGTTFPTPLEDLSNIAHPSHIPYASHAYEYSPASTYLNTGSPTSPINLSAEAITAAAYLLAYPSYPGPYH